MQKQNIYNSYNLFKIPELKLESSGDNKKIIIGLIDASGSMGSFWASMVKFWNEKVAPQADVLITFSQLAKVQDTTFLNQKLKVHGGGMTNILDAFKKLQERFVYIQKHVPITVVFISDGDDTVNGQTKLSKEMLKLQGGQGRDITFLCLGIQSGFPTKISMQLRQLYHTGDETIPAIFLIEYASQKAFFNKFQTISKFFKASNKISIQIGGDYIKQYPWLKDGQVDFKEGKWIMVHKQFPQLQILYNDIQHIKLKITSLKEINLEDFVDCMRGWVQKVQLLSMDNSKIQQTKKIASDTAQIMRNYTLDYEKLFNIFILTENKDQKQSFKDRAMGLAVKNKGSRIKWYLDELAIIAKGVGIGQLNEYQAAKRLGIGTITGKYHQKALALKGITVKDFMEIKQEFAQVFKNVKLSLQPSKQEGSIFTLQNQKQVFQQQDLLQGLQFCKSQYDFVQTFPVVGYGLKVKRYDGSMINPWKVRVQSLAKTHKTIDSMYLAKNSNKYELSIGQDQKQQINAVLPLFYLQDGDMSQLFNTRLFKLAVSFMVVQNIDTYHDQAYLALLGTTYAFMLKQPKSQWRSDLMDLMYSSLKVTYGATAQFQQFIQKIEQNPYKLWQDKGKQEHVDIVKILIIIFYISREGRLSEEKLSHLVDLALVHYCEKTYVQNEFKIFRVCEIKVTDKVQEQKDKPHMTLQLQQNKNQKVEKMNIIKNRHQLRAVVDQKMKTYLNTDGINVILSDKIFLQQEQDRRVTYSQISNFYQQLTGKQLNRKDKQILYYFGHYLKGTNQQNYLKRVTKDLKDLQKTLLLKIDLKSLGQHQGKQFKKLRKVIQQQYTDNFRSTHFDILPMNMKRLKQQCKRLDFDPERYILNQSTGMIKNTCMSPHCLYYFRPMEPSEVIDHLRLWRGELPPRFHMTVANYLREKKTPEEICEILFKSNLVNLKRHTKNKQFVINYIKQIQEALI